MLAGEEWKECVVMRAGGHNGVVLDSSVGVFVEFQHRDTLARFSHPHVQKNLVVFSVSGTRLSKLRRGLDCLLSVVYAP